MLVGAPWQRRTALSAHELLRLVFHRYVVLRSGWEWELPLQAAEFRRGSIFGHLGASRRWLSEGRVRVDNLATMLPSSQAQPAYLDLLHQRTERLSVVFDWTNVRR